jgi:5-methylcytosine-specific restriction endonuclease McrBC regulatory subunit McrC
LAPTINWNKTNMQNPTKLRQYRTLYNKLKDIPDANKTEGEWDRIRGNNGCSK